MPYPESSRDPLPKGESYPVSRTSLDAALTQAGVEQVSLVYFMRYGIDEWKRSGFGEVARIDFIAGTRDYRERLEIRIHAVPAALKEAVRLAVAGILKTAAEWVRATETSENVWRSSNHSLLVKWDRDGAHVTER